MIFWWGNLALNVFWPFPFLFLCSAGQKNHRRTRFLVGNQKKRTTLSRGFLSFLICLWQFYIVQILSGLKIFMYVSFLLSFDLWSGTFLFLLLSFNVWSGSLFFLLFSFDLLTRNFLFSFSFNVWQGIFLILFSKACWQLNNEWVLFLGEIPLLLLSRARMEILILGWGLWWFEVWAQKAL